jgi:hypothetical protein
VLTEVRLEQGTKTPEAGHQANEARVTLFFSKKGHRLAYHISQLQMDEKHRQWKWAEGCVEKIQNRTLNMGTL